MASLKPKSSLQKVYVTNQAWTEIVSYKKVSMDRENAEGKRTSMSRHVLIRNLTTEWLTKEAEVRDDIDTIVNDQKRIMEGRRRALWKSWVYHVAAPLANSLQIHLNKKCMINMSQNHRALYQKYLDYSNNPNHVISLDFYIPEEYDPFILKNHPCRKVITPPLHDPLLMKWRDGDEEKKFIQSDWPSLYPKEKDKACSQVSRVSKNQTIR